MEDLFYGLLALLVFLAPLWALFANIRKTRRLESEMWDVRKRLTLLERSLEQSSAKSPLQPTSSSAIAPHQLATLIDLETLKQESAPQTADELPMKNAPTATIPESSPKPLSALPSSRPRPPVAPKPPTRTTIEWEALIGGRLFNRIGAAAIIIGIGFFLKYAFDNDIISEPLRVLIGIAAGLGLIAGAERMQRKNFPVFAQGLVGAGIGTLYLSVYAAYNFYHLVPPLQAFAGMIGVTVIGFVLALRYNVLAIALLAWFGGYLTPLLIHSEQPNPFGLMAYLSVLSLGMLALVLRRDNWFILKPLSFLATYTVCGFWYLNAYTTLEHFGMTTAFAVIFWLMFFVVDLYRAASGRSTSDSAWRRVDSFLNSSISYAALFAVVYDAHPRWMPLVSVCYGSVYFFASQFVRVRQPAHTFAFMRYTLTAITQMVAATAQQFGDEWTMILWSVEFVGLFAAAARWRLPFVNVAAFVLSFATYIRYFVWRELPPVHTANGDFINLPALVYIILTTAFLCAAILDERLSTSVSMTAKLQGINILHFSWVLMALFFIGYELSQFRVWNEQHHIVHSAYWYIGLQAIVNLCASVVLAWAARKWVWKEVTWLVLVLTGVVLLLVVLRGFVYDPSIEWTLALNIRVAALLAAFGAALALWKICDDTNTTIPAKLAPHIRPILAGSALILVFTMLTGEASDAFHSQVMRLYALPVAVQQNAAIPLRIASLENAQQLSISLVWLVFAAALMVGGFARRLRAVRLAALGLAALAVLKIFLYDLSFLTTPYRISSFIGLGVVLLLVSYLYQRFKDRLLDTAA